MNKILVEVSVGELLDKISIFSVGCEDLVDLQADLSQALELLA